jgi:hypothetical protein
MTDNELPRVRYFVINSTTGLTFHNFYDEEQAMEAVARMGEDYHIGREFVTDTGTPLPFKEGEHHG